MKIENEERQEVGAWGAQGGLRVNVMWGPHVSGLRADAVRQPSGILARG